MAARPPSHLRAALRLLARGVRAAPAERGAAGLAPRRRMAVESPDIVLDPDRVRRFRRVTESVEGEPGEGEAVPPVFAATWETALALELLVQHDLPFPRQGLIHLESELVSLRPLRVGDAVRCRLELDRAEEHPRGLRLTLRSRCWNGPGRLCQEGMLAMLLRGVGGGAAAEGESRPAGDSPDDGSWRELARWTLPANLGRRYARASGDFNPIHLWGWSSRLLGFDRPILHGYCTEALVAHSLVRHFWQGDPAALRRLRISFRSPLALPADVRLLVAGGPDTGRGRFHVVSGSGEGRLFAEGDFVGG